MTVVVTGKFNVREQLHWCKRKSDFSGMGSRLTRWPAIRLAEATGI
jgi:hypothetical protein